MVGRWKGTTNNVYLLSIYLPILYRENCMYLILWCIILHINRIGQSVTNDTFYIASRTSINLVRGVCFMCCVL